MPFIQRLRVRPFPTKWRLHKGCFFFTVKSIVSLRFFVKLISQKKKTEGFLEMRSVKILMLLVEVVVHCIQRRRRRPFQQNEGHTKAAFLPTTYIVLYSRSISCCWNILSAVVTAFFLQYSATLLLSAKLGGPVSPSLKVWRTTTKTKQPLKKIKKFLAFLH